MNQRHALWIGLIQLGLAIVLGAAWLWAALWQVSSVADMADDLVREGVIAEQDAEKLRTQHGSIGAYLQQGWDARMMIAGVGLIANTLVGAGVLIGMGTRRPRLEQH